MGAGEVTSPLHIEALSVEDLRLLLTGIVGSPPLTRCQPSLMLPLAALSSRVRPGLSLLSAAHHVQSPRVGLRLCLSLVSLAPQELEVWKEVLPKSDPVNLSWKSLGKTVSSESSFSQRNSFCRERPGQEALSSMTWKVPAVAMPQWSVTLRTP